MWDSNAFKVREEIQLEKVKEPAEFNLGKDSRIKIIQGNACVVMDPNFLSVCWDNENKGETVFLDHISALHIKRLLSSRVSLIFNKDETEIVGIEIT